MNEPSGMFSACIDDEYVRRERAVSTYEDAQTCE